MKLTWDDFVTDESQKIENEYLPVEDEGDSMATQAVTATVKLIYKWFNDGDVFDNVHSNLNGWANNLSSYANWLDSYIPETEDILRNIKGMNEKEEYTQLLYDLYKTVLNNSFIEKYKDKPKVGTIYDCRGPYEFDDGEDDYDDDYDNDDDEYLW